MNQNNSGATRKRCALSIKDKENVLNIYKVLHEANKDLGVSKLSRMTANAAGIAESSVYKIMKEHTETGVLLPPKKKPGRVSVLDQVNEETKGTLRRIVHSYFRRNELPTLNKLVAALKTDENIPTFSRSALYKILKHMGFRYVTRSRKSMLIEKDEIIIWRRDYLRKLNKYREDNREVFYLDETWMNAGHTTSKVWVDETVKHKRHAFVEGLSTGLKNPSGKGKRFIITHIGSATGFVEDGLLLFESNKTGDHHSDMISEVFEKWFSDILTHIPEKSVIVLDNASYHSRRREKVPCSSSTKKDVQDWLASKNVEFREDMVKAELLQLVKLHKPDSISYVIDEMVKQNKIILRLPPYHCELNPIELIFAQVKGDVARNNTTFKLQDVKVLFHNALSKVTADNWKNAIDYTKKIENEMWTTDIAIDATTDELQFIVNTGDSSDELPLSETSDED